MGAVTCVTHLKIENAKGESLTLEFDPDDVNRTVRVVIQDEDSRVYIDLCGDDLLNLTAAYAGEA